MRADRVWAVVLGMLVVSLLAFALYRFGPSASFFPGCLFHRLTGLQCPGCGMTRAAYATLHGRLGEAFRFNPVGMVLFPAALVGMGLELIGWVRGKPLPPRFRVGGRWAWGIAGVLLVFWILRNIPVWPFTLLAPP
jgi:hypothetical protein